MALLETTISVTTVRMRYADHDDAGKATEWLDFQVPIEKLVAPLIKSEPFGDPELRHVAEVRLAALRYVRDLVGAETQRLSDLANRMA